MSDKQPAQSMPPIGAPVASPMGMIGSGDSEGGDEFQLGPIIQTIRAGWKWPVLLGGVAALLALIMVLITSPKFEAGGSLYLASAEKNQPLSSDALSGISLLTGLVQGSNMDTQIEIIRSRDMVQRAILASGINAQVWNAGHRPGLSYAGWVFGGRELSLYAPPPHALRALYAEVTNASLSGQVLTIRFAQADKYQILHHGKVLLTGLLGQPAVGPDLRLTLDPVQPQYVPAAHAEYQIRINSPLASYDAMMSSGALSVSQVGGLADAAGAGRTSYLVGIHYQSADPYAARRFVQTLMQTYLTETGSWSTDQAGATYDYLSGQLKKIRTALSAADTRLANFQSKSGVISVPEAAKELIQQLATYETQRSQTKITLYGLQQIQKALAQPDSKLNPYLFSNVQDPVLNGLSTRLAEAQTKLDSLQKLYTSAAPQVVQVKSEIASIRSAIGNLVNNQERIANQQLQSIDSIIGQTRAQMGSYPRSELEIISLTRSTEVLGKLYMFLLQKQEEAAVNKASTLTKNRVLDTALVRDKPVAPDAKREILLDGLLGVLLGLGIVLGRYWLHPGFRSEEEVRRRYPFLPVYGLLPAEQIPPKTQATSFKMPDPRSSYGEALRLLRGNLYLAAGEGRGQVLALSSAIPGDGKSTLAFQLAVALAQDGKKVLLLDADLRKPHAHLAFRVAQEPGLAAVLAGRSSWEEALHHIEDTGIDLITAGNTPPNPSEHLGSGKLAELLVALRSHYDYIVMDTPPFPMVGDMLTIGPLVDRLLTVAKIEHTPRRAYQEHLQGILGLHRPSGLIIFGIHILGSYRYGYGIHAKGGSWASAESWRRFLVSLRNRK